MKRLIYFIGKHLFSLFLNDKNIEISSTIVVLKVHIVISLNNQLPRLCM